MTSRSSWAPETLSAGSTRRRSSSWPAGPRSSSFRPRQSILPQGVRPQGRIRVIRRGCASELVDRRERRWTCSARARCSATHPCSPASRRRYGARAREDSLMYSLAAEDVIPLLSRPSSLRFLARSLLSREPPRQPEWDRRRPSAEVARGRSAARCDRWSAGRPSSSNRTRPCGRRRARWRLRRSARSSSGLDGGGFGIVTDRDLRSGVVAGRLSSEDPVTAAMTAPVFAVGADQTGADVMLPPHARPRRPARRRSSRPRSERPGGDRRRRPRGGRGAGRRSSSAVRSQRARNKRRVAATTAAELRSTVSGALRAGDV